MARIEDADARLARKAERERQEANALLQTVQARNAAWWDRERASADRFEREDREAVAKNQAERQSQHEGMQRAQAAWATERTRLETECQTLRTLLVSARGALVSADLADARVAASDIAIYEARLAVAERTLATHLRAQPAGF